MGPKKAAGGNKGGSAGGKDGGDKKETKGGTSVNVRVSQITNRPKLHLSQSPKENVNLASNG